MPALLDRAARMPRRVARRVLHRLPITTRTHVRAAVTEGGAALRSLADGATDATERALDRIGALLGRR